MRREKLMTGFEAVSGLLKTLDPALAESELNKQIVLQKPSVTSKNSLIFINHDDSVTPVSMIKLFFDELKNNFPLYKKKNLKEILNFSE